MDFYSLKEDFFRKVEYKHPNIEKYDRFKKEIDYIFSNNKRVLLYGDYDVDGLMCVLAWKEFFRLNSFTNYEIYKYNKRTHQIDPGALNTAIILKYDYIIINDAGSSSIEDLERLRKHGIKVILIDHHRTIYNYENCELFREPNVIINSTLDSWFDNNPVSAGALVFMLLYKYLDNGDGRGGHLSFFALTSLYSDCIDMSSELNRSIYFLTREYNRNSIPIELRTFIPNYMEYSRRFIEFRFSPKINASFRAEQFAHINKTLMCKQVPDSINLSYLTEHLNNLHSTASSMVGTASDIIYYETLGDTIVANLNSVGDHFDIIESRLNNYTGLIANKLADRYKKCCVVYYSKNGKVHGSFRDLYGRNYLEYFKTFCDANGHNSAFGFNLPLLGIDDFLTNIKLLDENFTIKAVENEPIIIKSQLPPDDHTLFDMAIYNEFAGVSKPLVLLELMLTESFSEKSRGSYGFSYKWKDKEIKSYKKLVYGTHIRVKPSFEGRVNLRTI